jgi:hypothetical protein
MQYRFSLVEGSVSLFLQIDFFCKVVFQPRLIAGLSFIRAPVVVTRAYLYGLHRPLRGPLDWVALIIIILD